MARLFRKSICSRLTGSCVTNAEDATRLCALLAFREFSRVSTLDQVIDAHSVKSFCIAWEHDVAWLILTLFSSFLIANSEPVARERHCVSAILHPDGLIIIILFLCWTCTLLFAFVYLESCLPFDAFAASWNNLCNKFWKKKRTMQVWGYVIQILILDLKCILSVMELCRYCIVYAKVVAISQHWVLISSLPLHKSKDSYRIRN